MKKQTIFYFASTIILGLIFIFNYRTPSTQSKNELKQSSPVQQSQNKLKTVEEEKQDIQDRINVINQRLSRTTTQREIDDLAIEKKQLIDRYRVLSESKSKEVS